MRIQRKRFSLSLWNLPNTKAAVPFSFLCELWPLYGVPSRVDWIWRPSLMKYIPAPFFIWGLANEYDAFDISSAACTHCVWTRLARRDDAWCLPRHSYSTFSIIKMKICFIGLSRDTFQLNVSRKTSFFKSIQNFVRPQKLQNCHYHASHLVNCMCSVIFHNASHHGPVGKFACTAHHKMAKSISRILKVDSFLAHIFPPNSIWIVKP